MIALNAKELKKYGYRLPFLLVRFFDLLACQFSCLTIVFYFLTMDEARIFFKNV